MTSSMAVVPNAVDLFTEERMQLMRVQFGNNAPPAQWDIFIEFCRTRQLDPLQKQAYLIERQGKWTIQTSIDGYRAIADRTNQYAGSDDAVFTEDNGRIVSATVTVYKLVGGLRCPFTATARMDEYFPENPKMAFMWNKMPRTMIAKCAESLALRKAFPAELSGLYTDSEMEQAGPVQTTRTVDTETGEVTIVEVVDDGPPLTHPSAQSYNESKGATDDRPRTKGGDTIKSRDYALVLCEEAGTSEKERHQMLFEDYGVESLNDLNQADMSRFVDFIQTMPKVAPKAPKEPPSNDDELVDFTEVWKRLAKLNPPINAKNFEQRVGKHQREFQNPTALYQAGITAPVS